MNEPLYPFGTLHGLPQQTQHSRDIVRTAQRVMRGAGLTVDRFNQEQARHFFGQQCVEMTKKLRVIAEGTLTPTENKWFRSLAASLEILASELNRGLHEGDIMRADHAALLEADFSLAMASVSAVFSTADGNPEGAIAEGCTGLIDQFLVDDSGHLHLARNDKGHPVPRAGWQTPDFGKFVESREE